MGSAAGCRRHAGVLHSTVLHCAARDRAGADGHPVQHPARGDDHSWPIWRSAKRFRPDAVAWGTDDPGRHHVDAICRQARAARYSARTLSRTGSRYSRNAAGFSDIGKVADAAHNLEMRSVDEVREFLAHLRRRGRVIVPAQQIYRAGGIPKRLRQAVPQVAILEVIDEIASEDAGAALHVVPHGLPTLCGRRLRGDHARHGGARRLAAVDVWAMQRTSAVRGRQGFYPRHRAPIAGQSRPGTGSPCLDGKVQHRAPAD